jgi:hypothetical protein
MLRPLSFAALLLLAVAPLPAVPEGPPRVLVLGFTTRGAAFDRDPGIAEALEIVAEEWLGRWFDPVSAEELSRAPSFSVGGWIGDPEARIRLAREVGADRCVCGWVAAFGERFILVLEVIEEEGGLPGVVVREDCRGIEALPDALERALARALSPGDDGSPPTAISHTARWLAENLFEDGLLDRCPSPDVKELRRLLDTPQPATAAETERLVQVFIAVVTHWNRLRNDPDYRAEWEWRTRVSIDPVLRNWRFEVARRGRFLVFVDGSVPRAADLAEKVAGMLSGVREGLLSLLDLPADPPPGRLHRVMVHRKEEHRRSCWGEPEAPVTEGAGWFYSPADQWVIAFVDAPLAMERWDEPALRNLRHGAVHQILHALAKTEAERAGGEDVPWTDGALVSGPFWLKEGFAGLVAAILPAGDPAAALSTADGPRLSEWAAAQKERQPAFTLAELLAERDTGSMLRTAARKGLANHQGVASLFQTGAVLFCGWLANGRDGALRPLLLEAVRSGIRGAVDDARFVDGLGGDLAAVEAEWRAWIESAGS